MVNSIVHNCSMVKNRIVKEEKHMDMHVVWKVLGIEETKDTELIKKVYHDKLKNIKSLESCLNTMVFISRSLKIK